MPLNAELSVHLIASEEAELAEWFTNHYPLKHIIGGHLLTT